MAEHTAVTPNRRGMKSRQLVLDAAERVMSQEGFDAATVARVVEESGIPMSSVYHYFGSKEGILLAVMERGNERFLADVPDIDRRLGTPEEHLTRFVAVAADSLVRHPDFLRLVVVFAVQPSAAGDGEVHAVVERVRELALERLRKQIAIAFDDDAGSARTDRLARFVLAAIDGAFVASRADRRMTVERVLAPLPAAMVAAWDALA